MRKNYAELKQMRNYVRVLFALYIDDLKLTDMISYISEVYEGMSIYNNYLQACRMHKKIFF